MKRYRVMYRPFDRADENLARTEEFEADGWRVDPDTDAVLLYQREADHEVGIFEIPKSRFMRINEIAG
jgi:hypothetical protein